MLERDDLALHKDKILFKNAEELLKVYAVHIKA